MEEAMKISGKFLLAILGIAALLALNGCGAGAISAVGQAAKGADIFAAGGQVAGAIEGAGKTSSQDPTSKWSSYRVAFQTGFDRSWQALREYLASPKNTILEVKEGPALANGVGVIMAAAKMGGRVKMELRSEAPDKSLLLIRAESNWSGFRVSSTLQKEVK